MALVIRMRQQGRKNRQTFRLVVADKKTPRDGKYLESVGSYDPHRAENNLQVNAERLTYWLGQGAQLSESAERLVKGVAPAVIETLQKQRNAARVKRVAARRKLGKKEAAPKAAAKVEAAPKKRRTTTKKTKDEV